MATSPHLPSAALPLVVPLLLALVLLLTAMVGVTVLASAVIVVAAAPHVRGRFDELPGVRSAAAWMHR